MREKLKIFRKNEPEKGAWLRNLVAKLGNFFKKIGGFFKRLGPTLKKLGQAIRPLASKVKATLFKNPNFKDFAARARHKAYWIEKWQKIRKSTTESKYWEQLLNLKVEKFPSLEELLKLAPRLTLPLIFIAGLLLADLILQSSLYFFFSGGPKQRSAPVALTPKYFLKSKDAYQEIIDRNLFCPGCAVPDMEIIAKKRPKDCNKARPLSGGGFNLIGTIVLSNADYSVATLSDGSQTYALKRGDQLGSFGEVFEIRRNRVCVSNHDGLLFYLELPSDGSSRDEYSSGPSMGSSSGGPLTDSPGVKVKSENEVEISRSFIVQKLNDPNILYEAYATPYTEDGQIRGFRIQSINSGSTFEKIGFKAGDIITEVDGKPMDSLSKAQELYATAASTSEINITVLRDGNRVTKTFTVK
ncbi:MAG: PDZ domain-containing protein [Proteobacteria bacterium]|nr:PDZ domain-containing protein [Pseudomonadota bacterium]